MSRAIDRLVAALKTLPPKPPDTADRSVKQRYSQKFSETVAVCFAEELHELVNALEAGEPGDRAYFLLEASRALNLPEIGALIAELMVGTLTKGDARPEDAA